MISAYGSSEVQVIVNGVTVNTMGYTTDVTLQTHWGADSTSGGGGPWAASWRMPGMDPNFVNALFEVGAITELRMGGCPLFRGKFSILDRDSQLFTARGLVQYVSDYIALEVDESDPEEEEEEGDDLRLVASSTPNKAIDRAISEGAPFTRIESFCGDAGDLPYTTQVVDVDTGETTTQTQTFNSLDALLSAVCLANGYRWGVDEYGRIYAKKDDTQPTWIMIPDTAIPGVSDSEFLTDIYARYCYGYLSPYDEDGIRVATSRYLFATVHVTDENSKAATGETREGSVNLLPLGPLSDHVFLPGDALDPNVTDAPGKAAANAQGRLDLAGARMAWSDSIRPMWYQILSLSGVPAPLWQIKAGDMVRLNGVLDERGQLDFGAYRDVIISVTNYVVGSDTIEMDPLGLVPRDINNILTAGIVASKKASLAGVAPGDPHWFTG